MPILELDPERHLALKRAIAGELTMVEGEIRYWQARRVLHPSANVAELLSEYEHRRHVLNRIAEDLA